MGDPIHAGEQPEAVITLNIDPTLWSRLTHGDRTAWEDFAGTHALQHTAFNVVIRRLGGAPFASLPLGNTPRSEWLLGPEEETETALLWLPGSDWLSIHQAAHEGMASSLLIASPPDLESYDLQDPDEFATWTYLHAQEHVRIRQSLGI